MRKLLLEGLTILTTSLIFFTACKKEYNPNVDPESATSASKNVHGHIKQTTTFSSDVVLKWMEMQLRLIRTTAGLPPATNSRLFGYSGVALYEAVVPGMPAYQSLSGQLTGMPVMPKADPGFSYHWAASANTALAYITRQFFQTTSTANKTSLDSLEGALNNEYKTEVTEGTLERSITFGYSVAKLIFDWSKTDGSATIWPAYTLPTGPGMWVPTPPNNPSPSTPFWGKNRVFVPHSLDNSAPTLPPPYSIDPNSAYYKNMKEVYDLSQSLTPAQLAQALYYRDSPGYVSGGHYLSILYQLFRNEKPSLDFSAVAFAKTGIAVTDALIGCFQWKYGSVNGLPATNTERPITFIQNIMGYTNWSARFNTPPHPDFPSGHATTAGAAEVMFTSLFGENYSFTNHTYDYLNMPTQSYTSFHDMADQIGMSRVYAGIHTRYACDAGRVQGQKIAQNILATVKFLKE